MRLIRLALPLGLGAVAALGLEPLGLWPLTLVGLAGGVTLLDRCGSARQAAGLGWLLGTGYFLLALVWIVQPFLVDPVRHGWMAPFALLFMAGGLALFWGLGFGLAHRLGGGWALLGALTGAELLRSYLFTGFPWALVGHALIDTPLAQLAALGGAHLLGLAVLLGALGLARAARRDWTLAGLALIVLAGGWFWGMARLEGLPEGAQDRPVMRLVQPNAPQHLKWHPDHIPVFFRRQVEFTAAQADPRPDLILWPETAIPTYLEDAEQVFQIIAEAAGGVPVVLGVERLDDMALYNSAVMLDGQGRVAQLYDKHHLVPFGEYIPLGALLSDWGLKGLAAKDGNGFAAGPGPRVMDMGPELGLALPLICYEAVFPNDARARSIRPDFLMQLTNDAWFGTFSGPYQHLAQARLRAIEQGLPLVRAANTGVSAMIDAGGRIRAQIPLGQAGWVDAALPLPVAQPLYAMTGDWAVALLSLLVLVASGAGMRAKGRRKPR